MREDLLTRRLAFRPRKLGPVDLREEAGILAREAARMPLALGANAYRLTGLLMGSPFVGICGITAATG